MTRVRYLLLLAAAVAPLCPLLNASTDLNLNFSGTTSQIIGGHSGTGSGSGTVTPYGNALANVSSNGLDVVTVAITVSLPDGDYFQATTESASGAGDVVTGTATIIGATGQFSGISGAINFTLIFAPSGSDGTFTLTGSGFVGSGQQTLVLSQSGIQFVAAGTAPPAQTVFVANPGTGSLAFNATASTLSGNANWLSVTPASGTSTTASPAPLNVSVDPTNLAPGAYYGSIAVTASGALNSPQLIEVVLNVPASGVTTPPQINPTGLVFVAAAGVNPGPQTVQVTTPANATLTLQTEFAQGNGWFSAVSNGGGNGQTVVTVSVDPTGLSSGIYNGTLLVQVTGESTAYPVAILLVVPPEPATTSSQVRPRATASTSCIPTQLLPVFTLLGDNFQTPAAWPTPLQLDIVDDCGQPMITGSVTATFSNGDPALPLAAIGNGAWSGTWAPQSLNGASVTVSVAAQTTSPALSGAAQISGSVTANSSTPSVSSVGVVSAASYSNAAVAPGSFISIFGSNLATGLTSSASLPLDTMLGGTFALIGDQQLPLQFTSGGQINAIVPYNVPVNATQQLLIVQNNAYSVPQPLSIATAQPAVFTQNQSGQGAGIIVVVKPDQTQFLATAATPASSGDALVIYCAGLGAVSPSVATGSAAPASPLSETVNATTVTIGGQAAQVLFSGLAPGFAGLYQVNAVVPSGIASSANVPVILTVANISSPAVTVAIQ